MFYIWCAVTTTHADFGRPSPHGQALHVTVYAVTAVLKPCRCFYRRNLMRCAIGGTTTYIMGCPIANVSKRIPYDIVWDIRPDAPSRVLWTVPWAVAWYVKIHMGCPMGCPMDSPTDCAMGFQRLHSGSDEMCRGFLNVPYTVPWAPP